MIGVTLDPSAAMSLRVSASMMTLVAVALGIRVWAKCKSQVGFRLEDLLIMLAAAMFYSTEGTHLYRKCHVLFRPYLQG
jgi:uncharacterized membrane protein YhfC